MNFRDKNMWASALAGFSFWGYLGSAVYGMLYAKAPAGILFPATYYWYFLGDIWITCSCFMFGYGVLRLVGRRRPIMIVGGFFWGLLSLLPKVITFPVPWDHLATILGLMGLGAGMAGYIFASAETHADSVAANLISGWGLCLLVWSWDTLLISTQRLRATPPSIGP